MLIGLSQFIKSLISFVVLFYATLLFASPWNVGDVVRGPKGKYYYVTERLGQGGFATVYRAFPIVDGKINKSPYTDVAIRVSSREPADQSSVNTGQLRERLLDPISRLQAETHIQTPSIRGKFRVRQKDGKYPVHDYYTAEIQELAESDLGLEIDLNRTRSNDKSISDQKAEVRLLETYTMFKQILSGLNQLHANGLVHYDLKPDNILVFRSKNGKNIYRINDFDTLTRYNDRVPDVFTEAYVEPERDFRVRAVDPMADYYQLAVSLRELLLGDIGRRYMSTHQTIEKIDEIRQRKGISDAAIEKLEIMDEFIEDALTENVRERRDRLMETLPKESIRSINKFYELYDTVEIPLMGTCEHIQLYTP